MILRGTVRIFKSVGKFTPDEVDKTAFVCVDLPAFFGDDKTFLGKSFNGNGNQIAIRQNAIAGQNRQGDALLDDIPDARKVGGIMENLWLELLPVNGESVAGAFAGQIQPARVWSG